MQNLKIYTCSKMANRSLDDVMNWRRILEKYTKQRTDATFFHPPFYYNYAIRNQQTEEEIKEYELNKLRECNVLIVELKDIDNSIGAMQELGVAWAMNNFGDHHIFVIGYDNTNGNETHHPWVDSLMFRVEDNLEDIAYYIAKYLAV